MSGVEREVRGTLRLVSGLYEFLTDVGVLTP